MAIYKCIECQKEIKSEEIKRRVRCPFCGNKILYKPRTVGSTIKAI